MPTPLDFLGWKGSDKNFKDVLFNYDKVILLFPHSSKYDLIIASLYLNYDPSMLEINKYVKTIVRESSLYSFDSSLLVLYSNPLPVKKGTGATKKIIESLKDKDKFILLISPKGSTQRDNWSSGWYHMAKELDAYVVSAGADYEKNMMVCPELPNKINDLSLEEATELMKQKMKTIAPYNPHREECKKDINTQFIGWLNTDTKNCLSVFLLLLFLLGVSSYSSRT